MIRLAEIVFVALVALAIGLPSAWFETTRGWPIGALTIGEWTGWPAIGRADADPYSLARLAFLADLPLGSGEGLAFTADSDSSGATLDAGCSYVLVGDTPQARLWTLTAYDAGGALMTTPIGRTSFNSREILRRPDGRIDIAVGPSARPGNWLPLAGTGRFSLVLRLYDTPLTADTPLAQRVMPRIVKGGCA